MGGEPAVPCPQEFRLREPACLFRTWHYQSTTESQLTLEVIGCCLGGATRREVNRPESAGSANIVVVHTKSGLGIVRSLETWWLCLDSVWSWTVLLLPKCLRNEGSYPLWSSSSVCSCEVCYLARIFSCPRSYHGAVFEAVLLVPGVLQEAFSFYSL